MNPPRWLLLAVLTACSNNPSPGAAPAATPSADSGPGPACSGDQVVTVTNDWNGAVDIFARVGDEARPRTLGTLQPGNRAEFAVPPGAAKVYALQAGRDEPNALTINMQKYVRLRYGCR